jgi:hypothetical protein
MRERARTILVLVVAVVALGVAGAVAWWVATHFFPAELTKAEASQLLRSSDFMGEMATTRLVLYHNQIFPAADLIAEHRDMVKFIDLGLIEVRPSGIFWGKPIGAKLVLTTEGERAAAAGWRPTAGPAGEEAWIVPTARKELIEVRELRTREGEADCKFVWKWTATKIGHQTGGPKGSETAGARFHRDEDRWSLDEGSIVQLAGK